MSFLDGLRTIWSDPDIRRTAIGCTVAAAGVAGVASYAVTRRSTKKWRQENEEYLNEPGTVTVDGELYKKMKDGTLVPLRNW